MITTLSERDARIVSAHLNRLRKDGNSNEISTAVSQLIDILARYDISFSDLAENPNILLDSGNDLTAYQEHLTRALEANEGLATQNGGLLKENTRLRRKQREGIESISNFWGLKAASKQVLLDQLEEREAAEGEMRSLTAANKALTAQVRATNAHNYELRTDNAEVVSLRKAIKKAETMRDRAVTKAQQKQQQLEQEFNKRSKDLGAREKNLNDIEQRIRSLAETISNPKKPFKKTKTKKPFECETFIFLNVVNMYGHYHYTSDKSEESLEALKRCMAFFKQGGGETVGAINGVGCTEIMEIFSNFCFSFHGLDEDDRRSALLSLQGYISFAVQNFTPLPNYRGKRGHSEFMVLAGASHMEHINSYKENEFSHVCKFSDLETYLKRGGRIDNSFRVDSKTELTELLKYREKEEAMKALLFFNTNGGVANAHSNTEANFVYKRCGIDGLAFYCQSMEGKLRPDSDAFFQNMPTTDHVIYQKLLNAQEGREPLDEETTQMGSIGNHIKHLGLN